MTIKMIDKWVTSLRFNEIKNEKNEKCWFLINFIFCRLAETAVSGSPSVTWLSQKWCQSGESVQLPSLIAHWMCMCVVSKKTKKSCRPTVLQQTVTTHKAQLCISSRGIDPLWGENGSNLYNSNELTLMLHLSHAHLCSKHFTECDFVNFMVEYQRGFASKQNL